MSTSTHSQIFNEKCGMVASIGMSLIFLAGAAVTGSTITSYDKPQDTTHNEATDTVKDNDRSLEFAHPISTTVFLLAASGLFGVAALSHRRNANELLEEANTHPKPPQLS